MRFLYLFIAVFGITISSFCQTAVLRGVVKDAHSGDEIISAVVTLAETRQGAYSDERGFFNINRIKAGEYTVIASYIGYDSVILNLKIREGEIKTQNFYLNSRSNQLEVIKVSAEKIRKRKEVYISQVSIKPKQLQRIPSVGGEPDLVQYLQVLPGVVFSGDQGGQLYIRGGSPVMNRVMMDGLTIYNPFHSIGLFSVFDSDILKSVDVYSAGFSAEYGGRVSAIVDVKTRDGNKKEFKGKINASPFNAKLLLEGPLKPYVQGENHSSYILSYKNSYLNKAAPIIYPYVNDGMLPYSFSDLYAKLSFNSSDGSKANLFGFNYQDNVDFQNSTSYNWVSNGLGVNFLLIPGSSKTLIDGSITYSDYEIQQKEIDNRPRRSAINGYNVNLNFTYLQRDADKLKYGIEMNGFQTDFEIYNSFGRRINQKENTTELNGYINYLRNFNKKFLLETGVRVQRYASLQENSFEPRIRAKYIAGTRLRFKGSAGRYSQNLMSAVSDKDVVNLFYGFLSGPKDLPREFKGEEITSRLQKANHAVVGFEFDINTNSEINIETYIKDFTQITNINRDKIFDNSPENNDKPDYLKVNYIVEEGVAKGYDITYKYESKQWYVWAVYSYNIVNRFDGQRTYQPHFDRRHNFNFVNSYDFGDDLQWSANIRWNYGSGFPFTLTQGFYELVDFNDGAITDYTTENGDLGILYADLNTGRLPYYHRLDASLKRTIEIADKKKENSIKKVEAILSVTNVYNRANIFYFNRVEYKREDQLPFLPSLSVSYSF
jgi:hypothetical protein